MQKHGDMNEAECSGNRRKFGLAGAKSKERDSRRRVAVEYVADKFDGGQTEKSLVFVSKSVDCSFGKKHV